jgi:hypothetical protein
MNNLQKVNLLRTAKALLLDKVHHLEMANFAVDSTGASPCLLAPSRLRQHVEQARLSDAPLCGTSTCFAGYGPVAGIAPLIGEDDWRAYIWRVYGVPVVGVLESFLFSCYHPNCAESCAVRALIATTRPQFMRAIEAIWTGYAEHRAVECLSYDNLCIQLGDGTNEGKLIPTAENLLRLIDEAMKQFGETWGEQPQ